MFEGDYIIFEAPDKNGVAQLDWRPIGNALPSGAVPLIMSVGGERAVVVDDEDMEAMSDETTPARSVADGDPGHPRSLYQYEQDVLQYWREQIGPVGPPMSGIPLYDRPRCDQCRYHLPADGRPYLDGEDERQTTLCPDCLSADVTARLQAIREHVGEHGCLPPIAVDILVLREEAPLFSPRAAELLNDALVAAQNRDRERAVGLFDEVAAAVR